MNQDEIYMKEAIGIARKQLKRNEYPFGCCIVYNGNVVIESNTCFSGRNPLLHAEINAINRFIDEIGLDELKKSVLYATTEPCLMCFGAINWVNIPRLVYGTSVIESSKLGFFEINVSVNELRTKLPYDLEIRSGVLHEECMELFQEWQQRNKRIRKLFTVKGGEK